MIHGLSISFFTWNIESWYWSYQSLSIIGIWVSRLTILGPAFPFAVFTGLLNPAPAKLRAPEFGTDVADRLASAVYFCVFDLSDSLIEYSLEYNSFTSIVDGFMVAGFSLQTNRLLIWWFLILIRAVSISMYLSVRCSHYPNICADSNSDSAISWGSCFGVRFFCVAAYSHLLVFDTFIINVWSLS